ncbi:MAG: Eco57I restriction-modification methylase domain-containing protein [Candidatus Woesearchaeota archaeon]
MNRGQFFTRKEELKKKVFELSINKGRRLEPSAGAGDLCSYFEDNGKNTDVAIEIDNSLSFVYDDIKIMNFFDFSIDEKFDSIYGNPPYVKQQMIEEKEKIQSEQKSLNLFLYFIEKSFYHLNDNGEIVFIIPREFFTNSRASKIRELLYNNGTITHVIDYQERKMFDDADPYIVIIRYEKDNFNHETKYEINGKTEIKNEIFKDGFIKFVNNNGFTLDNLFDVKVGIVSGANDVYENEELGNIEIICSDFVRTKKRRRFIFFTKKFPDDIIEYLKRYKNRLINRKIRSFDESNWFEWGAVRNLDVMSKEGYCIYVNSKTRESSPFFIEKIGYFDGSVLAIIPKKNLDLKYWVDRLNNSKKEFLEQGFLVGNKYQFSQKSLSKFIID